jgi:hypothetical protein
MRLSPRAREVRDQIEEAFLCSRDNDGIARYFRVPPYEVGALRQEFEQRLVERASEKLTPEEWGSTRLKEKLDLMFKRWERRNGFRKGAGQMFLLAGYKPQ